MTTLKVGSRFYKVFMGILFLTSLYQVAAYCADDRELAIVELTGSEEDFWGEFYWPWGSATFGDPETAFMTWEKIIENDVTYHGGFLFFVARNDREQLNEEGVKDSLQFDLVYDLVEKRVYGTLTGYAVSTMDFDKHKTQDGDWLHYASPQTYGRELISAVCEAWVEIPIDFELTPDGFMMTFEGVIDVDVIFHARVKRSGYPLENMVDVFEEKTRTVSIPITINGRVNNLGGDVQVAFRIWTFDQIERLGRPLFSYSLECGNPCTAITQVEWKEPTSEPDTSTSEEEEEPISETNTSEPATDSPVIVPDSSSTQSLNLSGILLQGAVSAGAGFGLVEMLKRFFGKTSMEQLTPKDLELLKEKLNKASTGASEGEDVLRLPTEDKYQKRNRISRERRSSPTYQRHKKRAETDNHYSKLAKGKNWTPKQEQEAIKAAKPKWLIEYTEKRMKKVFYFGKRYKELYKELPESEKKAFDSWNKWSTSWMRRHGAGKVGKFSDPHSFEINPGGSRA